MNATKPTVLCFSHDYSLLITRQLLLEKLECTILCAMSIPEFLERLTWRQVDLVVLCQTIKHHECAAARELTRLHAPKAHCLIMYVARTDCDEGAETDLLQTSQGPMEFLRAVRRLLAQPFPVRPVIPGSAMPQASA